LITEFFTIVKNRSGTISVLDQKGFKYSDPHTKKKTGIEVWKCSKRTRGYCKANVHILGEYIIHHFEEHNHDPEKIPF
jgi:hypothetical protein